MTLIYYARGALRVPNRDLQMQMTSGRCAAAIVLVLAAAAFAPAAARADAALFNEYCAKCHARAAAVARGLKGETSDATSSQLDTFLKSHHADDAQVRARIVAYLVALSGK